MLFGVENENGVATPKSYMIGLCLAVSTEY